MTIKRNTKSALISALLILCLCFTALIGTTFAWFTDTVTSGNNIIKSGKLDIVMEYWDGTEWVDAEGKILEFQKAGGNTDEEVLWEPGCTYELPKFRVRNVGNLAAKILIKLNGITGDEKLMEVIELTTTISNMPESVVNGSYGAQLGQFNNATIGLMNGTPDGTIIFDWSLMGAGVVGPNSGHTDTSPEFTITGHMSKDAGDEYQDLMIQGISITVLATQEVYEYDSVGREYDENSPFPEVEAPPVEVTSFNSLKAALANGKTNLVLTDDITITEALEVNNDVNIDGQGYAIARNTAIATYALASPEVYTGAVFTVKAGNTLVLADVVVDGGAVWTGEVNEVLQRGTVNAGVTSSGSLIATQGDGCVVLNEGTVIQNCAGTNAIFLDTRGGGSLTVNGAQIINNASGAGAIWGGGNITVNEGSVINGNASTYYGGVVRFVGGNITFTMNGGEMNHNYTTSNGGALGGGGNSGNYGNSFILNGGEMAYNYCDGAGGAIYTHEHSKVTISGDFAMHDNYAGSGLGNAIRFAKYSTLTMTGGNIYGNGDSAFWSYWTTINISGGTLDNGGVFHVEANSEPTVGGGDIKDVYHFDLGITRYTINLIEDFGTVYYTVNENLTYFMNCNFKPAEGYTYTEGDEAKLVCMNEGYSTYWDATTGTFRLQADN